MIDISIVIPVYNEGTPLISLCKNIVDVLIQNDLPDFEIILVDDRSRDNTWQIMKELAAREPLIKIARLSRNFGQHSALTAGLTLSKGKYIIMMDCDGQDSPEYIPALYEAIRQKTVQIVYAKRKKRKDNFFKIASSRIINQVLQALSGNKHDAEIGTFRIMTKFVSDTYLSMPEKNRFIGGMFNWLNFDSDIVEVEHKNRASGKSNYSFTKLLRLARLGILSSSTKLLSLGTYIGLFSALFSLSFGMYFLFLKIYYNVPMGYTSVIVSIFFVGSIIMLLLGIIGEYLREIFEEIKARPNFIIEEKYNF